MSERDAETMALKALAASGAATHALRLDDDAGREDEIAVLELAAGAVNGPIRRIGPRHFAVRLAGPSDELRRIMAEGLAVGSTLTALTPAAAATPAAGADADEAEGEDAEGEEAAMRDDHTDGPDYLADILARAPQPSNGASAEAPAALELTLRRLDDVLARFDAAPDPAEAQARGERLERKLDALAADLADRIAEAKSDLRDGVVERVVEELGALRAIAASPRPSVSLQAEQTGMQRLSVALQTMLRRMDAQIARLEEATAAHARVEARLERVEAALAGLAPSGGCGPAASRLAGLLLSLEDCAARLDGTGPAAAPAGAADDPRNDAAVGRCIAAVDSMTGAMAEFLARLERRAAAGELR